ncbi:WD40 repeat-like protein [Hesseltinella vesiculosa]|uniref:WD40 repeat-like protein n=1 Tax=Hesseltinella vesiculosa TaxID=101127 RepID=A0A1X2GZF6_9FUNG|nr:WD40 repeat-like protein [Hesseltinella vesiculosa]
MFITTTNQDNSNFNTTFNNSIPDAPPSPPVSSLCTPTPAYFPSEQVKCTFQHLSSRQQEQLLTDIIDQCDHTQLAYLHNLIAPRLKVDFLKRLPMEIALAILSHIDKPFTLAQIARVSRHWNKLLKDDSIWKRLCAKYAYDIPYLHAVAQPASSPLPVLPASYRALFRRKFKTNADWQRGGQIRYVDHGLDGLVTSLQCDDKYIVVGCDNHRIEVFDTATGRKVRTLLGHEGGVWALEFKGGDDPLDPDRILVSAGCDRDVRVWNLETGELLHVLAGHAQTVRCLKMKDKRTLVTGSRDYTLRIWDIEQGKLLHVLVGHQQSIRCLDICDNILVSGSYDTTARIWDLNTGTLLHVLSGHQSQIYSIVTDGEKVATGSYATHIRVWSVKTGECLAVLHGHTSLVGQLELVSSPHTERGQPTTWRTTMVSGGADGCIRVWDWDSFECLQRISAHDNSITCIQTDHRWMVSGGNDGRVKLWNPHNGRLIRTLTTPAKLVWKLQFNESKAILVMQRPIDENSASDQGDKTVLEIHDFDP